MNTNTQTNTKSNTATPERGSVGSLCLDKKFIHRGKSLSMGWAPLNGLTLNPNIGMRRSRVFIKNTPTSGLGTQAEKTAPPSRDQRSPTLGQNRSPTRTPLAALTAFKTAIAVTSAAKVLSSTMSTCDCTCPVASAKRVSPSMGV